MPVTELGSSSTFTFLRPADVEALRREHRRLEERRAAAARAAVYSAEAGTWDDTDWWALQLGRTVQLQQSSPLA